MNVNQDLIGKTITGVIASSVPHAVAREIWMLQFSDGTHVEFVSPRARKALRSAQNRRASACQPPQNGVSQLALNVA
jgi:hypothetical protein